MKKHIARQMIRIHGRRPIRKVTKRPNPNDVTRPPDTWSPEMIKEMTPEPEVVERRPWGRTTEVPEIQEKPEPTVKTKPEKKLSKRRDTKVTISLSSEEEHILKTWIREQDIQLSRWARQVLFDAMGKKIPPRH